MSAKRRCGKRFWITALIGVAAVLLAACAGEEATAIPTTAPPTPTPTPVVTGATPTPVPATPTPTAVVGEQPKHGGVLNMWARREPPNYDPPAYGGVDWQNGYAPVVEGLVVMDPENPSIIRPRQAESWEISEDGKTYTFHLRKGVKWHDGVPFTAEDVVYGWNRFFNPPEYTYSDRRAGLASFKEVRKVDDYTVVFEFGATEVEVMAFFGYSRNRVLSKHQLEPIDQEEGIVPPEQIGTGPFKLAAFRRESLTGLERNPDYWAEGLPYLDGIRFAKGRDQATMFAAFRTGRIDISARARGMYLTASQAEIIKEVRPEVTVWMNTTLGGATVWPNNQREPWTDIRVRRAISLGIDRQFVCQVAVEGLCLYAMSILPGAFGALPEEELMAMPGYRQPKDQDLAEAKRLLAEAGFPNGFTTEVAVRDSNILESEPLAFELEKLGIQADLRVRDTISHEQVRLTGEFNIALSPGGIARTPGMITAWLGADLKSDSAANYGQVKDAKLDDYLDRQAVTVDTAERKALLQEMIRYMLDQAFYTLMYVPIGPTAVSGDVKGFISPLDQQMNHDYTEVWLDR